MGLMVVTLGGMKLLSLCFSTSYKSGRLVMSVSGSSKEATSRIDFDFLSASTLLKNFAFFVAEAFKSKP